MINRVASSVKKYIEPVTSILDKIGTVIFILMVVMLIYSVIVRKAGYPRRE